MLDDIIYLFIYLFIYLRQVYFLEVVLAIVSRPITANTTFTLYYNNTT